MCVCACLGSWCYAGLSKTHLTHTHTNTHTHTPSPASPGATAILLAECQSQWCVCVCVCIRAWPYGVGCTLNSKADTSDTGKLHAMTDSKHTHTTHTHTHTFTSASFSCTSKLTLVLVPHACVGGSHSWGSWVFWMLCVCGVCVCVCARCLWQSVYLSPPSTHTHPTHTHHTHTCPMGAAFGLIFSWFFAGSRWHATYIDNSHTHIVFDTIALWVSYRSNCMVQCLIDTNSQRA